MHVVRGDHVDSEFGRDLLHALRHGPLVVPYSAGAGIHLRMDRAPVLHHLQIIVFAENVLVPAGGLFRLVHAPRRHRARHLPRKAGGRNHKSFGVFREKFAVYARMVVESFARGLGHQPHKVPVSGHVLRKQYQVRARLVAVFAAVVAVCHVRFAAEYRLDGRKIAVDFRVFRAAFVVERLQREKIAVVCDGERGHPELPGAFHERRYLALAVEKRVGRVDVEMDEIRHCNVTSRLCGGPGKSARSSPRSL